MTENELIHFGIKGMKWGVRRYQTESGDLTPAGKKRYSDDDSGLKGKIKKRITQEKEADHKKQAIKGAKVAAASAATVVGASLIGGALATKLAMSGNRQATLAVTAISNAVIRSAKVATLASAGYAAVHGGMLAKEKYDSRKS